MAVRNKDKKKGGNVTSRWLTVIHALFLLLAIAIVGKIVYLQVIWKPSPMEARLFGTSDRVDTLYPVRGAIYDTKGRLIASSVPMYQVTMDATVRKTEFANDRVKENDWRNKAYALAQGLASIYGGSTENWYSRIIHNRQHNVHYLRIGGQIDYQTLQKVKSLPLFNEGAFKGGIGVEIEDTRKYPYGSLGRRAIGVVSNNRETQHITGIEEKCNDILHGKEGYTKMAYTDVRGLKVAQGGWKSKKAVDGLDVRTTLDMDVQDIADKALREVMVQNEHIVGGCCMVMEVKTGAIRAMANLKKDHDGNLGETYNFAVTTANNPGSVFKTATLMAALDEGKIGIHDSIPCMGGVYVYKGAKCPADHHVGISDYPTGYIAVDEGLKISSNHVFRYIGGECFGKSAHETDKYIDLLKSYHLFDKFDFDINGLAQCTVINPNKANDALVLPMVAMGYDMATTPIHIMTFYNAIANGGKEVKPYLIEDYEEEGKVVKEFGTEVLNPSVCRKSVTDTLTQALLKITQEEHGTAYWRMRGSKCKVAGKTGTAFIAAKNSAGKTVYHQDGLQYVQGTFVGFFPAEAPEYTAICVIYTDLCADNIEGSRCATAVRIISDELYTMHPEWGESIKAGGRMPRETEVKVITGKDNGDKVPDVVGLGLSDAMYSIESCGYHCTYEGSGQVVSQSPAAYTELKRGSNVVIRLK